MTHKDRTAPACRLLGVLACLVSSPWLVAADDPQPPAWRGGAFTTLQTWDFDTNADPVDADSFTNPYGTPSADINPEPLFATGWYDTFPVVYGTRQGFWDVARGTIDLSIPTGVFDPARDTVLVRLQVTYWQDPSERPIITIAGATLEYTADVLAENVPGIGDWRTLITEWRAPVANPTLVIQLQGDTLSPPSGLGSIVDGVVVDLQFVPEPGATAAVAAGVALAAAGLVRRLARRGER